MANIYKKYNSYYFSIEAGKDKDTGKRHRIIRGGFKTKKEAQKASVEIEAKLNSGCMIARSSNITLHEFAWNHWLEYHKNFIKLSTLKGIETNLRKIDKYFGEYRQIKSITRKDCQDFAVNMIIEQKLKRSVAKLNIGCLHQIFEYAINTEKILSVNPAKKIDIPNPKEVVANVKPLYLEKDVLQKFLKVAQQTKRDFSYYMATLLLIYTGMRAGEAIGLEWKDIDLEKRIIYIRRGYYYLGDGKYVIHTPKTKTSARDIPISDQLINELKQYRKRFIEFKLANASRWEDSGYDLVLTSIPVPGRPFSAQALEHWLKRKGKKIGIDYLRPHIFRHTHVSLLAEQGVPLEVISDRLGHIKSNVTRNVYLHVTQSSREVAAEQFDKIMAKIKTGT